MFLDYTSSFRISYYNNRLRSFHLTTIIGTWSYKPLPCVRPIYAIVVLLKRSLDDRSTVVIETTIKVLGYINMLLNIATNASFEDKNEGDTVDSKAKDNGGTANAVEAKVINGHAEQEATDDIALPPTANTAKFE
ncbi:hypothetical protein MAM1_0039c02812 [Mucor ambiguus]|uniref:Uncharacterized protein n=1 Tax=Mucor ambiguus TaxID=91626 RepID=A0A0C9M8D3_9FUNG|nr:hypothetical protein MAM1_0039c02812 [Mucor ambiguus]